MAINIIKVDNNGASDANDCLLFTVDPGEYTGKKVLAVPRCCQTKEGDDGSEKSQWNGYC